MKVLGAILCEILNNREWRDRLYKQSREYYKAANTPNLSDKQRQELKFMGSRADNLSDKIFQTMEKRSGYANKLDL